MDSQEKKSLNEIDICDLFITPAVINSGWGAMRQIRREVTLTPGSIVVIGNLFLRNKKLKNSRIMYFIGSLMSYDFSY